MVIESSNLMKRTVAKNDFNIQYLLKGRLVDIDIYKEAPFTLVPQHIVDSAKSYEILINSISPEGGTFLYGLEKKESCYLFVGETI
jgi:hypothetical protein